MRDCCHALPLFGSAVPLPPFKPLGATWQHLLAEKTKSRQIKDLAAFFAMPGMAQILVGGIGFEPTTSTMST